MSDLNAWNGGDPFAREAVEDSIAHFLRTDTPATSTETPSMTLVRTLADAYALPPAADAVLARSRAILARRAEALGGGRLPTGGVQMLSTDSRLAPARFSARPPQPPRRRISPFPTVWRTVAAVLVISLLSAGFYALLRGMPRPGGHPTPTSATATPGVSTPTTIPPQPPAPAGIYVTAPEGLFRLDPSTGAVQQQYSVAAPNEDTAVGAGGPIVANGIVYYASAVSPQESAIVAVSATSGAQLWRTPTATNVVQLSLVDGTLYFIATSSTTVTGSDRFYALRARDGRVLWTFPTGNYLGEAIVTGGVVYLPDEPQNTVVQHIHALRASDGSQLWDTALPQACGYFGREAADQGMVFVSCGIRLVGQTCCGYVGSNIVYGLRARDGRVLWHSLSSYVAPPDGVLEVAAAGGGLVYVTVLGQNAAGVTVTGLVALDETTGAVRWQVATAFVGYLLVFDGTTLYADIACSSASSNRLCWTLEAFSASDGKWLWTYSMGNLLIGHAPLGPVIAGGVVYAGLNGQVMAVSASNGTQLWRSPALDAAVGVLGLTVVTGG